MKLTVYVTECVYVYVSVCVCVYTRYLYTCDVILNVNTEMHTKPYNYYNQTTKETKSTVGNHFT